MNKENPKCDIETQTEEYKIETKATYSGKQLKKELAELKETNEFCILVVTQDLLINRQVKDGTYMKYVIDKNNIIQFKKGDSGNEYSVFLINYGSVLNDDCIKKDVNGYVASLGFLQDDEHMSVYTSEKHTFVDAITRKKFNKWEENSFVRIEDMDEFDKETLTDLEGNEMGYIYIPTRLKDVHLDKENIVTETENE